MSGEPFGQARLRGLAVDQLRRTATIAAASGCTLFFAAGLFGADFDVFLAARAMTCHSRDRVK